MWDIAFFPAGSFEQRPRNTGSHVHDLDDDGR
jgi:hypothetical protein